MKKIDFSYICLGGFIFSFVLLFCFGFNINASCLNLVLVECVTLVANFIKNVIVFEDFQKHDDFTYNWGLIMIIGTFIASVIPFVMKLSHDNEMSLQLALLPIAIQLVDIAIYAIISNTKLIDKMKRA